MANPLQMFDITADQIDQVVGVFYARVRQHPELGPVFAAHIAPEDWPAHEEKITRFWRNAILKERCYDGQPMRVHLERPKVQTKHFTVWLELFDQTLTELLPAESALAFSNLAHRIGDGFRFGIEARDRRADQPPSLL
ncbi:group III truncated hemoglobin [uncultured Shimia sp.]|uniref:group III truncated hemoglobin n=1 Tax=uncultured Shimia sp. TaxID=573152 RepID=UPI002609B9C9|nr:group III truncated hemoglobin [uncultured Shimia sp.]